MAGERASGIMPTTKDGYVLFLKRSENCDEPGTWCFPGGMIENGEAQDAAARREMLEETGHDIGESPLTMVDSMDGYVTNHAWVDGMFTPKLNDENVAFSWAPLSSPPEPLHPGVRKLINSFDMAQDSALEQIAFDRATVRNYDKDGHLHIEINHISKANVCEYLGKEIPGHEGLGLEPNKLYKMLRDPEELAKGAATFAGKPILLVHKHIHAYAHPRDQVVGAVGTEVTFEDPYLRAPLSIWDGEAILLIDSGVQKELSSSYRYRADMTPGEYKGEPYDGVIRDIVGNHVALVKDGRVGSDVVVGDSKENILMSKKLMSRKAAMAQGALLVFLQPKLAMDSKIDLGPILDGVSAKNFAERKATIAEEIRKGVKLAKDASLDDLMGILDTVEKTDAVDEMATDPSSAVPLKEDDVAQDDDMITKLKAFLAGKLSDEDMAQLEMLCGTPAADAEIDLEPGKKKEDTAMDADPKEEDKITKKEMEVAMDSAIKTATKNARDEANAIHTALEEVKPYVGKLALAFDSAAGVYAAALGSLKVDLGADAASMPLPALRAVLRSQRKIGEKTNPSVVVAMDSAVINDFSKRYPDASRIGHK